MSKRKDVDIEVIRPDRKGPSEEVPENSDDESYKRSGEISPEAERAAARDVERVLAYTQNQKAFAEPTGALNFSFNAPKAGMRNDSKGHIDALVESNMKGTEYYARQLEKKHLCVIKAREFERRLREIEDNPAMKQSLIKEFERQTSGMKEQLDLTRNWVHIDIDMFYVAVELIEHPQLVNQPVAVGDSIITTSNYIARSYGVRSALPTHIAKQLCKHLIVLPRRMGLYQEVSKKFMDVVREYDPDLESLGLDEAKIDITDYLESKNLPETKESIEGVMHEIRSRINSAIGITASSGYAANGFLAKICGEINKPNGQFYLPKDRATIENFVEPLEIRKIPGIGPQTQDLLNQLGMIYVKDMRARLFDMFILFEGQVKFLDLALKSYGISNSRHEYKSKKSYNHSETFSPTQEFSILESKLLNSAQDVAKKLQQNDMLCKNVAVSIKFNDVRSFSKAGMLPVAVDDFKAIYAKAKELLHQFTLYTSVRLLGVRVATLIPKNPRYQAQEAKSTEPTSKDAKNKAAGKQFSTIMSFYKKKSDVEEDEGSIPHRAILDEDDDMPNKLKKYESSNGPKSDRLLYVNSSVSPYQAHPKQQKITDKFEQEGRRVQALPSSYRPDKPKTVPCPICGTTAFSSLPDHLNNCLDKKAQKSRPGKARPPPPGGIVPSGLGPVRKFATRVDDSPPRVRPEKKRVPARSPKQDYISSDSDDGKKQVKKLDGLHKSSQQVPLKPKPKLQFDESESLSVSNEVQLGKRTSPTNVSREKPVAAQKYPRDQREARKDPADHRDGRKDHREHRESRDHKDQKKPKVDVDLCRSPDRRDASAKPSSRPEPKDALEKKMAKVNKLLSVLPNPDASKSRRSPTGTSKLVEEVESVSSPKQLQRHHRPSSRTEVLECCKPADNKSTSTAASGYVHHVQRVERNQARVSGHHRDAKTK